MRAEAEITSAERRVHLADFRQDAEVDFALTVDGEFDFHTQPNSLKSTVNFSASCCPIGRSLLLAQSDAYRPLNVPKTGSDKSAQHPQRPAHKL